MAKLKQQWWCIKQECSHHRVHYKHEGKVVEHMGCTHPEIMNEIKFANPNIGFETKNMRMCPVLVNDTEACIKPEIFDRAL